MSSIVALLIAASGCQEVKEPTTTLTQAQWEEVKRHLLQEEPKPQHVIGAKFEDKIELIGMDVAPSLKAGSQVTVTYYWRALGQMSTNWQVFVHFDHIGKSPRRQGLDHDPVRGLYQTTRWKKGDIVKDVQTFRLPGDYPAGKATFFVGLWDKRNARLKLANPDAIKNDGENRIEAVSVDIKGGKKVPPPMLSAVRTSQPLVIDGKLDDVAWSKAKTTGPLGSASGGTAPGGETTVKVLYDDEAVYFGLKAKDTDIWGELSDRDADTWTQEVLEIFIDPGGDAKDYVELQFTPKNTVFDARFPVKLGRGKGSQREQIDHAKAWNASLTSAVHVAGTLNKIDDKDDYWSVEVRLPFADIPGGKPKQPWHINFYRFDAPRKADGTPERQVAWAWNPARGFFHNVQHFGRLKFEGTAVSPPPAPVKPPAKPAKVNKSDEESEPDRPE